MDNENFIQEYMTLLSDILKMQIDKHFDGNPTPENIKVIETYFNDFLFKEHGQVDGYLFQLELDCKEPGYITVERVHIFKNGEEVKFDDNN